MGGDAGSMADKCRFTYDENSQAKSNCCIREPWGEDGRCIWHSKTDTNKPIPKLQEALIGSHRFDNNPEVFPESDPSQSALLLDGAQIPGLDIGMLFRSTGQTDIYLRNANLKECFSEFGISLSKFCLHRANLTGIEIEPEYRSEVSRLDLSKANLAEATINNIEFVDCNFKGASLGRTSLDNCVIINSNLSKIKIHYASKKEIPISARNTRFKYCNLTEAKLGNSDLTGSTFLDCSLENSDLSNCDVTGGSFRNSLLKLVNFSHSDLTRVGFQGANLELTNFAETYVDGAKANQDTLFCGVKSEYCLHDPRLQEEKQEIAANSDIGFDGPKFSVAGKTYRKFERICRDNVLPNRQSEMFINRQDVVRLRYLQRAKSETGLKRIAALGRYSRAQASRITLLYGESPWRVIAYSLGTIILFGLLYPLIGVKTESGMSASGVLTYNEISKEPILLWKSFYHSAMLFATGNRYGGLRATNLLAEIVTTIEALLGPTLIALLVFVLGRRAAR